MHTQTHIRTNNTCNSETVTALSHPKKLSIPRMCNTRSHSHSLTIWLTCSLTSEAICSSVNTTGIYFKCLHATLQESKKLGDAFKQELVNVPGHSFQSAGSVIFLGVVAAHCLYAEVRWGRGGPGSTCPDLHRGSHLLLSNRCLHDRFTWMFVCFCDKLFIIIFEHYITNIVPLPRH